MALADEESDSNAAKGRKQGKAPTTLNILYTQTSFKDCKRATTLTKAQRSQLNRWKDEYKFTLQKLELLELSQADRERAWNGCSFS